MTISHLLEVYVRGFRYLPIFFSVIEYFTHLFFRQNFVDKPLGIKFGKNGHQLTLLLLADDYIFFSKIDLAHIFPLKQFSHISLHIQIKQLIIQNLRLFLVLLVILIQKFYFIKHCSKTFRPPYLLWKNDHTNFWPYPQDMQDKIQSWQQKFMTKPSKVLLTRLVLAATPSYCLKTFSSSKTKSKKLHSTYS